MNKDKTLFITGATGNLGREMIRLFLKRTENRLLLLVRSKPSESHGVRVEKLLSKMGINGNSKDRIDAVAGDVTQPHLGLNDKDWKKVSEEADEFYHAAALTNLGAERNEAQAINLKGTENVLELAWSARRQGRLKRFFYFSTAYVAGSLTPIHALEDELPKNPIFANAYEESKHLAERRVREELSRGLPATIFRPAIVVGDSRDGSISDFNVIYPFWRLFAHGLLKKVPSRLGNTFNIVPIDFVVQAAFEIAQKENSVGKAYHLVSENPPTLEMLLEVKEEYGRDIPDVEVVDPKEFSSEDLNPIEREIFSKIKPYLGYLGSSLTFDTRNTRQALAGSSVNFPSTDRPFLKKLIDYAFQMGYFLK